MERGSGRAIEKKATAITANFHKNQFCQEIFMQSGFTSRCEGNLFMERRAALIRGVSPNGFIPLALYLQLGAKTLFKSWDEMLSLSPSFAILIDVKLIY
jgi:hypothetical protein